VYNCISLDHPLWNGGTVRDDDEAVCGRVIVGLILLFVLFSPGPAPGCSIAPDAANAASVPTAEDRETFASIIKTVEKLLSKATKGSGAGTMRSKGAEPDTAFED
jgi:hypothetical protein